MKKFYVSVAMLLLAGTALTTQSCIGSFALTNKVLSWNNQVGSKFVNELVFFAFWVLPVYEVTAVADLLVINSIEFWSGTNPMQAGTKVIETDTGRYLVKCDGKGYDVVNEDTGDSIRLDFNEDTRTWSLDNNGEELPLLTFVDHNHVRMYDAKGRGTVVELSETGVMAYQQSVAAQVLQARRP